MKEIFKNKSLLILVVLFPLIGVGFGLVLSLNIFATDSPESKGVGDRLMIASGESLIGGGAGHLPALITKDQVWEQNQPLTLNEATNLRWEMEAKCTPNVGYYSKKAAGNDLPVPYSLLFNNEKKVIGMYLFSEVQQPAPWQQVQTVGPLPYPHWGLHMFFYDQSNACR